MTYKFQSLDSIFTKIYLKLYINVINVSGEDLSFDQFKKEVKIYVLNCVLNELKSFFLNDLYYRSKNLYFKFDPYKFFELIFLRVKTVLQHEVGFLMHIEMSSSEFNWVLKNLEEEEGEVLHLILYLIPVWVFSEKPFFINGLDCSKLLTAILENLIVKISNVFLYLMFFSFDPQYLTYLDRFCPQVDFLKIKKNDFYWQSYLTSTFVKPKHIYYKLYNLKVLTKYGISNKLVHISNLHRNMSYDFTNAQLFVLFYFELIEFIQPKLLTITQKFRKFVHLIFN